ncbi:NADH dehydrogenase [ubiquinone] 1 alpha subcomplex subunit 9, mitochondrial isoform X4 [Populus trichocarpa]|uniref:NADH dehydrogenase [ubiquinone] 1 alpha subcomplex subunit 9, mitochondrial isoform X4 n=1 Tax=Populus trichocarpa TaxID=3694 RepID=UPI000D1897D7|nr:NADH dehydrogenase [ubiquinone] 1 alpha subcomplex subunit 9, mitochondrial isoform X4 [Populus trichocarpa]|eukprot:XP_024450113.1 NADH dehydrogenase [ubiquinone] 1 alpha subcomplex subunit 9, mitochondrial isoform X3 [Populus trichocarpa]
MVSVPVLTISSCCHKHENWGNYSFEELNHGMAEQFAMISREQGGIMRFIQVSCFGASASSPSRVLRAKAAGEEAVLREMHRAAARCISSYHISLILP